MPDDGLPTAAEVLAGLPPALPDDGRLRESVRAMRAADGLLLGALDDDPTGSQAVHGVQVVTVLEQDAYQAAFSAAPVCFVLTNTRSLAEPAAVERTRRAADGLIAVAGPRGARIQLVSRSDSTLRGHVMAEVAALQAARRDALGRGFDGVLLVPAFLEAGRMTAGDIHWARVGGQLIPVGQTEFAKDAAFGYSASDLKDFISEKSGGRISRGEVASISLADIRLGGPALIADLLAGLRDGAWAVVNATEYSDLEAVACGVLLAERAGRSFLFRTGPSFVRALAGLDPMAPLRGPDIWLGPRRPGHGLIVVGSHVSQTSRQVDALRARRATADVELDVAAVITSPDQVAAEAAERVADGLSRSDVLLYTSRTPVRGRDAADGLAIARAVSAALSLIVAPRAGRRARLGHRQGRDHLPRRGPVRPGHPPRRGGRPAVPRHGLTAAPHRCCGLRRRHALCRVRRQRRRRPGPGRRGGHPQRGLTVRPRPGRPPRCPCPGG